MFIFFFVLFVLLSSGEFAFDSFPFFFFFSFVRSYFSPPAPRRSSRPPFFPRPYPESYFHFIFISNDVARSPTAARRPTLNRPVLVGRFFRARTSRPKGFRRIIPLPSARKLFYASTLPVIVHRARDRTFFQRAPA